jgi:hypothetical protein
MTTESTFVSALGIDRPDEGVDAMLDVLGSRHRRRVLSAVLDAPTPVALEELAAAVAAREDGTKAVEVSPSRRDGLRTRLHHVHLAKLDDVGLVEYDADARMVAGTDTLQSVAASLAAAE